MPPRSPRLAESLQRLAFALLALSGVWAYWPTIREIVARWLSDPDYSHGFLVVPLSFWLVWRSWNHLRWAPKAAGLYRGGLLLFAIAGVLRAISARVFLPELDAITLPIWIGGLVWLVFGRYAFYVASPAIAFLWFAIPLPASLETALSTPLQLIAAEASGVTLRALGQPAVTEGATILLGQHAMEVERACSGLRMFYGIAALAVALVILTRPVAWKAAVVLLSAPLVAIAANVLRIVLTTLLYDALGSDATRQLAHDYAALFVLPTAAACLYFISWLVGRLAEFAEHPTPRGWGRLAAVAAGCVLVGWIAIRGGAAMQVAAAESLQSDSLDHAAAGRTADAIESLRRYTVLRGDDATTLLRLGGLMLQDDSSLAGQRDALPYYRRAWQTGTASDEVGLDVATLALRAGSYPTAAKISELLLKRSKDSKAVSKAIRLNADAALAEFYERGSAAELSLGELRSLRRETQQPALEVRHVRALVADLERRASALPLDPLVLEADTLVDRLVKAREDDPAAWVVRYAYRQARAKRTTSETARSNLESGSLADLDRAMAVAESRSGAEAAEPYLIAASRSQTSGDRTEAERLFRKAIATAPRDHRGYLSLAELLRASDEPEAIRSAIRELEAGASAIGRLEILLSIRLAMLHAELGDTAAAEETVTPVVRALKFIPAQKRYEVELAIAVVRSRLVQATQGLEAAITRLRTALREMDRSGSRLTSSVRVQALVRLGGLQAAIGRHEAAVQSLLGARREGALDADSLRILAASATRAGDLDLAQSAHRQLRELGSDSIEVQAESLRVAIRRRARAERSVITWDSLERRLKRLAADGLGEERVALLRSEILVGRGQPDEAIRWLAELAGESGALTRELAVLKQQTGDASGALEEARRFVEIDNGSPESTRLLVALFIRQGRLDEAYETITSAASSTERPIETALLLAEIEMRRNSPAAAVSLLEEAITESPDSLRLRVALARVVVSESAWSKLGSVLDRLVDLEGEGGVYWRLFGAQQNLATAESIDDPRFAQAARLSEELINRRSDWPESLFLRGEVERRLGNGSVAEARYQQAWQRGKRDVITADRLLATLIANRKLGEARRVIDEARDLIAGSPRLFDRVVAMGSSDVGGERVLALARGWAENNPNSAMSQLRLARALLLAEPGNDSEERQEEIRTALRQAVALAPTDATAWATAMVFWDGAASENNDPVAALEELIETTPIEEPLRSFVLAQAFTSLGQAEQASRAYLNAAEVATQRPAAPDSHAILAAASEHFLDKSPYLATRLARAGIDSRPDSRLARVALVRAIVAGDDEPNEEVDALVELDRLSQQSADSEAIRLRATVLAKRDDPGDVEAAITGLERVLGGARSDQRLLARLHVRADRVATAIDLLTSLTDSSAANVADHEAFLEFWQERLLSAEDPAFNSRAATSYAALRATRPGRPAWLRWKLRELEARNESAPSTNERVKLVAEAVGLVEESSPGALAPVFRVALEEQSIDAAFAYAEAARADDSRSSAAVALCYALVGDRPLSLDHRQQQRLKAFVERAPDDADLAQAAGDYYLVAGDYVLACEAYTTAIERDPERTLAYNNLAIAYGERPGQADEATAAIDKALAIEPDSPDLLDTQAWLLLAAGNEEGAIERLTSISGLAPTASSELHLSMALDAAGRTVESVMHLHRAIALGVTRQALLPREAAYVDRVKAEVIEREQSALTSVAMRPAMVEVSTSPNAGGQ